jgi:hypothetical protein
VSRREEVQDVGLGSVDEEEDTGALEVGGIGVANGDTNGGREGLTEDGGGVGADGGLVHPRRGGGLGFVHDDVHVVDIIMDVRHGMECRCRRKITSVLALLCSRVRSAARALCLNAMHESGYGQCWRASYSGSGS